MQCNRVQLSERTLVVTQAIVTYMSGGNTRLLYSVNVRRSCEMCSYLRWLNSVCVQDTFAKRTEAVNGTSRKVSVASIRILHYALSPAPLYEYGVGFSCRRFGRFTGRFFGAWQNVI